MLIYIPMPDHEFLTTAEAAKLLGISRIAVFKKVKSGVIRAKKVGRNFIIPKNELVELLDSALTAAKKKTIEQAVRKTVVEYGETLRLLGRE